MMAFLLFFGRFGALIGLLFTVGGVYPLKYGGSPWILLGGVLTFSLWLMLHRRYRRTLRRLRVQSKELA